MNIDDVYTFKAKVVNVVDGDTIDCEIDLGFRISIKQRIRLARIDTPERKQDGFQAAKDYLHQRILGKQIILKISSRSKWGYYLGEIYLGDKNINQELVTEGHAVEYDGGTKSPESKEGQD